MSVSIKTSNLSQLKRGDRQADGKPFIEAGATRVHFPCGRLHPHHLERVKTLTLEHGWAVLKPSTGTFLEPTDAWGFPKYPDQTVILPPDADLSAALYTFVRANAASLGEPDCWLGTWVHPQTGEVYLDVTTSCRALGEVLGVTARINARSKRKIIAVYNSASTKPSSSSRSALSLAVLRAAAPTTRRHHPLSCLPNST